MTTTRKENIIFAGAGPGDPDLITVAGKKALEEADLIIFAGSLVPEKMLEWARPDAVIMDSASMNLNEIVKAMADAFELGKKVVRLHTGDPSLYGAINEQIAGLEKLEIPYRVIPGVTAAFASAASLGLEFTSPEKTQTLIITRAEGRTPVPEKENLKALANMGASMAIYLSAGLSKKVAEALKEAYGEDASLAVVYRASQPDERIVHTTVGNLEKDLRISGIDRLAVILAGPAIEGLSNRSGQAVSRLYDPGFSHGFRQGNKPEKEEVD